MKLLAMVFALILPTAAWACNSVPVPKQTGIFDSTEHFYRFIDERAKCVNVLETMTVVFGRENFRAVDMESSDAQLKSIFPRGLDHVSKVRSEEMGDGFVQGIRAYWREDQRQLFWVYYLLHDRPIGGVNVLNVSFHSQPSGIFKKWH